LASSSRGTRFLGDFNLHDEAWQEGIEPMRRKFSAETNVTERRPNADWRPRRIVQESGALVTPIAIKLPDTPRRSEAPPR
jgi:hypothetical protein